MFSQDTRSIRIVSVDHYMSKPDPQYDVCYSRFRGCEIRQVPVIRLFGTTSEGTHSCVHIHGVFPYFYIPYEGATADRLAVDKVIYQLATALDKAINVSLARSNSRASHVFKIVLVKGIPIYGYHRNAHNFLKIYMYNPQLVRNATTLLMNGAIPSARPQVHETHIPYVLQFFIDYNLYGMSFLHVNAKGLRQRLANTVEGVEGEADVPVKMSTSEYEIDVLASDILNREPDEKDTGEFANPGIASIWKDEETRRRLFGLEQPAKLNLSQEDGCGQEVVTESDRFYRALLASKLSKERPVVESATEHRPMVGPSPISYPSEATDGVLTLDASHIVDHGERGHSNASLYESQISYHFDLDAVEIDEDKISSTSQHVDASLHEEDYNMLEIMRHLEENEKRNFEGDCLLAPLTQQSDDTTNRTIVPDGPLPGGLNASQTSRRLNASLCGDLEALCLLRELEKEGGGPDDRDGSFDSDDEFLLDLTQKEKTVGTVDLEGLDGYLNDSGDDDLLAGGCIPQLDGGDDSFASRTPKRNRKSNAELTSPDIDALAKRIRIDLTQPMSKRSLTPRKVTFAAHATDTDEDQRGEIIRKQFEASSPHTLKECEIRVSKLSVMKKSILSRKSLLTREKSPQDMPLKNLRVRLTKLDPAAHKTVVAPAASVVDRYWQANEYDQRNNFNPMEGPSTLKSNRVRKPQIHKEGIAGQSNAKRMKLKEQQEIEVVLSERFKNIIRLSPKVLIKPLSKIPTTPAMSPLVDAATATAVAAAAETPAGESEAKVKVPEESSDRSAEPSAVTEAVTSNEKPVEADVSIIFDDSSLESLAAVPAAAAETPADENEAKVPDKSSDRSAEPSAATEAVASTEKADVCIIFDDSSLESFNADSSDKEEAMVVDLDDSNDESAQRAVADRAEPMVIIHLPAADCGGKTSPSSVPIGSQLDGVVEPMEQCSGAKDPATQTTQQEGEGEEGNQTQIESFCETTLICDVDDIGSDSDDSYRQSLACGDEVDEANSVSVRITLASRPPTCEQARLAIDTLEISAVVNATPFYGNPDDITGRKEVGHTVLHITGNSWNDLEEFKSSIAGLQSIKHLRYEVLKQTFGESVDEVLGPVGTNGPNADRMKELLASDRSVSITHSKGPPSRLDAEAWLDERIRNLPPPDSAATKAAAADAVELDSPVKVKKAGAIMTVAEQGIEQRPPSSLSSASSQMKIDSESSLNLSVLLTNDESKLPSSRTTRSLVSKIMTMNTYGTKTTPTDPSNASDDNDTGATNGTSTLGGYSLRKKRRKLRGKRASTSEKTVEETSVGDETATTTATAAPDDDEMIDSSNINVEELATKDNATTKKDNASDAGPKKDVPAASARCVMGSSEQSDLIEHSSANISMATAPDNAYGFKVDYENLQQAKPGCEYNYLTVLAVEMHVPTRGDLRPHPKTDPIAAIFYRIHNDVPPDHPRASSVCGIIVNRDLWGRGGSDRLAGHKYNQSPYVADVVLVNGERELYEKFLLLIAFWDPDIFTGYEIESASWGYIIERGYALEMNLMKMLSRVPTAEKVHVSEEEQQELLEMHDYSAGLKIPGRILLDIWRLMRHEIALTSYTFENVAYHILHRRVPSHSHRHLSRLWTEPYSCWIVLDYYLERVNGNFEILNQLDLIGRTAELAKLFGIQFYEVLSRGSQFRVESMMLRIAKPKNFVSVSPSIQQRAHMRAPEYLPLIMEPNSRFYADPIIVLDFQSLYPSVIIAYNYCFATCLGRIEHLGESTEAFEFGTSHLRVPPKMLKALMEKNLVTFSPCGIAFVKKRVREGVLPRMLSEILNTRLMVKKSMKLHKTNSVLQRVLHSRQLGLKLIANVTYGYTAANFSGRMPCVEIGDSVVAKGRETLERAVKLVEATERWGAKVVYGDTDSLFVLCPGRTKAEAFRIGEEIADAVTKDNPPPVKLKLEKVYQPSILQTKKRYVGYMYETADQEKPTYEAKGIETVRRDGCPVVAKMLEKVLRILFETCDVSKVKQYTCRQFTKILEGRVNLQDFIFAKEFRGEDGYKPGACVPALELSRKWKLTDPRREPRRGQRVPYVIINGPPLVPLIRLVRSPDELLADEGLKLNATYYISKAIIPPLNRCLLLIGADVHQWYNDLPRKSIMLHNTGGGGPTIGLAGSSMVKGGGSCSEQQQQQQPNAPKKSTISQYFSTTSCIVDCGRQTQHGICKACQQRPQYALLHITNKVNKLERKVALTKKMCRSCCQRSFETSCNSLDCPVLFSLNRRLVEHKQTQYYRELVEQFF